MKKTYRSATKLTFPLRLNGERRFVKFDEQFYGYTTSEEKEQKAIEESPHFKRGEIKLFKSVTEEGDKTPKKAVANPPAPIPTKEEDVEKTNSANSTANETDSINTDDTKVDESSNTNGEGIAKVAEEGDKTDEVIDYPNVTNINGAVEVLRGEPYNVHHMKLRNPIAIQEQAELNKVSFPNLKIE